MSWTCINCKETHEEQYDSCWKCGNSRNDNTKVVPDSDFIEAESLIDNNPEKIAVNMPCSTTPTIAGYTIMTTIGVVCGEAIMGANIMRDFVAGITDIVGGRSGVYETKLRDGRDIALKEMMLEAKNLGADAVIGVDIDYETIGGSMLMVSASGTAITMKQIKQENPKDNSSSER